MEEGRKVISELSTSKRQPCRGGFKGQMDDCELTSEKGRPECAILVREGSVKAWDFDWICKHGLYLNRQKGRGNTLSENYLKKTFLCFGFQPGVVCRRKGNCGRLQSCAQI